MAQLEQVLNYVKQINERLNLWVANAKKAEELPIMEIMDPDGLLIVSQSIGGVWTSKRLEVQKIIDGLSLSGQDNKVREVLLGTITEEHDLNYLLDNNGITVAANEIIVLTVLTTIDAVLVQKQFLWKSGKGEYNPIGSADISTKLIELQPRFLNEITADELTSSPSAIVYDFGIITDTILDVLNTADPARDYTDDEKIYYIRATKDDVNLLYNFVGINDIYGDSESQMVESDLVLVYSSANTNITDLLNNKLDKGTYTGDAGGLDNRITVLENQTLPPVKETGLTGQAFVLWSGTGLKYYVNYPKYYIQSVEKPLGSGDITLDDTSSMAPGEKRYDLIILDAAGINKITGVADENPVLPTIDDETQIVLTNILLNEGDVIPSNGNTLREQIFDENIEYVVSKEGGVTINPNYTALFFKGTKCLQVTNFGSGKENIFFKSATTRYLSDYRVLTFWMYLPSAVTSGPGFEIWFQKDGAISVSDFIYLTNGYFGYDQSLKNTWQLITIPISNFDIVRVDFNELKFRRATGGDTNFFIDDVALVKGEETVTPSKTKGIKTIITADGVFTAATPEDTLEIIGEGATVVRIEDKKLVIETDISAKADTTYVDAADVAVSAAANAYADAVALDKVDKVTGKGLSTEDYTTAEKNKLASIDATHYLPPLQTTVQLSAILQASISDKARVYVEDELSDFFYDATASSGDIAPDDQTGGVGFWKQVAVGGETAASIKTKYESNPDTNAFTDAEQALVATVSGKEVASNKTDTITGNETSSTLYASIKGIVDWLTSAKIRSILGISTLSGSNTGDQDLSNLVVKNTTITGATKTKVTYDSKGLVTGGADATTADITDSTNKRYQTDTQNTNNDATSPIQAQIDSKASKSPTIVETGSSFSLDNSYNGKIVILTGSCTVTLPNGLAAGFGITIVTLTGVTLTLSLGGSVTLFNNAGTTMAEKLSCTIQNRTATNQYITAGNL